MSTVALGNLETIDQHPYIAQPGVSYPGNLIGRLDDLVSFEKDIISRHEAEPIDAIIGDDVSGRVPALITHSFLRLAQAGGHIDTVPHTYFMASGMLDGFTDYHGADRTWRENLKEHAGQIVGAISAKNVLIITELVSSGTSVERLQQAFEAHGAQANYVVSETKYLCGRGAQNADRAAVGIEKYAPEATSRRHPAFRSDKTAYFRSFVEDYTKAVYEKAFGEPAPQVVSPHYRQSQSLLKQNSSPESEINPVISRRAMGFRSFFASPLRSKKY